MYIYKLKKNPTNTPKIVNEISKSIKCPYNSGSCFINIVSRILESLRTTSLSEVEL